MSTTRWLAMAAMATTACAALVACGGGSADRSAAAPAASARGDSLLAASQVENGQRVFETYCAMCHGDGGAGDGEVAPRFARIGVKVAALNDAETVGRMTREQIRAVIARGGGHTHRSNLMPSWANTLGPRTLDDVAAYVMVLPYRNPGIPSSTLSAYLEAPAGAPAEGRVLFAHHCVACHGPWGRGDGPYSAGLATRNRVTVRNLTDSTYFATRTDPQLFAVISLGGGHFHKALQMPAWTQTLSPAQIRDIIAYVRAISHTGPHPV